MEIRILLPDNVVCKQYVAGSELRLSAGRMHHVVVRVFCETVLFAGRYGVGDLDGLLRGTSIVILPVALLLPFRSSPLHLKLVINGEGLDGEADDAETIFRGLDFVVHDREVDVVVDVGIPGISRLFE